MNNPEQVSRRNFLRRGVELTAGLTAVSMLDGGLIKGLLKPELAEAEEMVETGDPLWDPSFTGMWFPGHTEVATVNNPQITDSLLVYAQATGDYGPYYAAKQKLGTLQQDVDPTAGYCSITASARALFPQPDLKGTYYGEMLIDYKTKMGLLTALATRRAKVALTNDPDQIIGELNQFLDGTATSNFVVERFVTEDQEWFSVVNAVGSTSFRSDDFSNIQGIFSINSIQSMYYPYLPVGRDREPVNPNQSWIIPVDMDTVLAMVYGEDWGNVKQQLIDKQNRLFNIV
ncbi:MAG: hypothetical protein Q7R49_05915 [Candidatus Daviesbacteria bacterium]|nr:hypothetical protein [Candidatus Daviesbacteria bacterium]